MSDTTNRKQVVQEAIENLTNYLVGYARAVEKILNSPDDSPILDEYCWTHDEGGWTCSHPEHTQAALDEFNAIPSYVERFKKKD